MSRNTLKAMGRLLSTWDVLDQTPKDILVSYRHSHSSLKYAFKPGLWVLFFQLKMSREVGKLKRRNIIDKGWGFKKNWLRQDWICCWLRTQDPPVKDGLDLKSQLPPQSQESLGLKPWAAALCSWKSKLYGTPIHSQFHRFKLLLVFAELDKMSHWGNFLRVRLGGLFSVSREALLWFPFKWAWQKINKPPCKAKTHLKKSNYEILVEDKAAVTFPSWTRKPHIEINKLSQKVLTWKHVALFWKRIHWKIMDLLKNMVPAHD